MLSKLRALAFLFSDTLAANIIPKPVNDAYGLCFVRSDNIGDFILWLPCVSPLSQKYLSNAKPLLICSEPCVDLAIASDLFSNVIGVNMRRFTISFSYRWSIITKISAIGICVAIQPTYSRTFLQGDSLIRATRAPQRIGSSGGLENMSAFIKLVSDRWFTTLIPASPQPLMEIYRNTEFLKGAGVTDIYPSLPHLNKIINLSSQLALYDEYFVLFPGASANVRQWPVESFIAAGLAVAKKHRLVPVVCGGPADIQLCDQLCDGLSDIRHFNFAGKTTIPELIEIIRRSRLLISNETSAIHLSSAVNTPSICILGGGHYGRFLPYPEDLGGMVPVSVIESMDCFGCNWKCIYTSDLSKPFPCISGIKISRVLDIVDKIISTYNPTP